MKKKRKVKDYAEIPYLSLHQVYRFFSWSLYSLEEDLKEILENVPYSVAVEVLDATDNQIRKLWHAFTALYSSPITQRKQKLEEAFTRAGYFDEEDEKC